MPYSEKQIQLAHAVEHGFHPTGKAKGFDPKFAHEVIEESGEKHKGEGKHKKKAHHAFLRGARL